MHWGPNPYMTPVPRFSPTERTPMTRSSSLNQIRSGDAVDPQIYGDDIIVVDQSGAKTGLRSILQTLPIFNIFSPF